MEWLECPSIGKFTKPIFFADLALCYRSRSRGTAAATALDPVLLDAGPTQ